MRANAYFDSQNLFGSIHEVWGYSSHVYDPVALARSVCQTLDFELGTVYFYVGIPDGKRQPNLAKYWNRKLTAIKSQGVEVFASAVRYDNTLHYCPICSQLSLSCKHCGPVTNAKTPREKKTDVRIAVDLITHYVNGDYDAALIFSQDNDFAEAAARVRNIGLAKGENVRFVSAFPAGGSNSRGITHTTPHIIDRKTFDSCLDPREPYGMTPRSQRP